MDRRRDAMRRLGAPRLCETCHRPMEKYPGGISRESHLSAKQCLECRRDSMRLEGNLLDRELAVHQAGRPSNGSYRQACEAMADEVAAALEDWSMGNGIIGPRY